MHYKMRKDGNLNDVILILQMKQGDEQAFDKFVRKYYGDILSYCKYHCLDQTEAEDLTQETFLRFMNNIQSYQHIGKAKNYLYVIAGNLCKNHVKKWKADCVEKEVLERKLISDGGIPKQEKQIYVKQALEQMNPELKEIIIMFYFQDFKLKEIADILWNAAVIPKMFFLSDSIFVQHLNCLRKRPVLSNFRFPCLGRRIIYKSVSAG